MDSITKEIEQLKRSNINLTVEPLQVKIRFQHIDFFNMIAIQVEGTLNYLQQLTEKTKEDKDKQVSLE